jgi:hypothetical protein
MLFIGAANFRELRKGIVLLSPGKRREMGVYLAAPGVRVVRFPFTGRISEL